MIVQVRGSKGSGKSTLVRRLLAEHGGKVVEQRPFIRETDGKPVNVDLWQCDGDLFVLGRYDLSTTSGAGGDRLSGQVGRDIIRHYARQVPHLVWESAWGSTEFPKDEWLEDVKRLGVWWAVLDTPFNECIRRIYRRREERGRNVGAQLNETKERQNWQLMHNQVPRALTAGIHVVTLNDGHAYEQLHDLLVYGGWPCACRSERWDWSALGFAA